MNELAAPSGSGGVSAGPAKAASMYSLMTELSRTGLSSCTSVGATPLGLIARYSGPHLIELEEVDVTAGPWDALLLERHAAPDRADRAPEMIKFNGHRASPDWICPGRCDPID
jgi:hypothetical protein